MEGEEFIIDLDIVYVFDKNETLITIFQKDDEDTIINPVVHETQNAEATFTFSISQKNPKWEMIKNPENLYIANGKMFSTNFEGCFTETLNSDNQDLVTVTAYERQKLLSRKYVRAWNSTTGFEKIDTFMVLILANGGLPLTNNDVEIQSTHEKGTSGYVLDGLLYGTGWKTGICDVEGKFDLETDQVDIYENILKVQEIWGGILVFDSLNKVVHHRDETKYLPYSGYEVKYQKNMQSLEKIHNNKIITKLCPLGEGGLNIKNVNDGSEWLTNFEYTDSVLEGIENNADITDQEQLKKWGERKLKDLCKPRKELTVQMVLLQKVPGYELETLDLNDIVDVINFQYSTETEQLRVVDFEYGLWDYSDAVIELSDITLDSTDIFKKNVQATNSINDGTLNSNRVVVYYKNGESLTNVILQIDETIVNTKSELTKADDEIKASVEQVTTNVDNLNNEIVSQSKIISDLKVSVGEISGNVASVSNTVTELQGAIGATQEEFQNFIDVTYEQQMNSIQAQIDGQIQTYFEAYEPTLSNAPANEWITEDDKINHMGDLFYNSETGLGYRFSYINNSWSWIELKDTDVGKALANAQTAQETANSKRRVFVQQPYPPYDQGDLWITETKELKSCLVARSSGSFNEDDWQDFVYQEQIANANEQIDTINQNVANLTIENDSINATVSETITKLENNYMTTEQIEAENKTMKDDLDLIKQQQASMELTSSGLQVQIDEINNNGVSTVKNTTVTIDEKGVTVGKSDSEFSTTMSNTGTYMYSYDKQIAKYDKDGAEMYNLTVQNEAILGYLRFIKAEVNGEKRTHIHWIGG